MHESPVFEVRGLRGSAILCEETWYAKPAARERRVATGPLGAA